MSGQHGPNGGLATECATDSLAFPLQISMVGTWIHLICLFFLRSFRFTVKLRDTESFHILSLL